MVRQNSSRLTHHHLEHMLHAHHLRDQPYLRDVSEDFNEARVPFPLVLCLESLQRLRSSHTCPGVDHETHVPGNLHVMQNLVTNLPHKLKMRPTDQQWLQSASCAQPAKQLSNRTVTSAMHLLLSMILAAMGRSPGLEEHSRVLQGCRTPGWRHDPNQARARIAC